MSVRLSKEITARFDAEAKRHFERWKKAHPEPAPPLAKDVAQEVRDGRVSVDSKVLGQALAQMKRQRKYYGQSEEEQSLSCDVDLLELLETASLRAWKNNLLLHEGAMSEIRREINETRQEYLDQVLFDHANAYVHLRDFKRWAPGGAPSGDPLKS